MSRATRILITLGLVGTAVIGALVRPSGIYEPAPGTPPAQPKLAGIESASAYVAVSESCRTPGHGRVAYCWFEGWSFTRKTICVDSSISGAPLATLASHYNGIAGLRIVVGGTRVGACAAKGYPPSQRVSFLSMSKNGAARYGYGICGVTQAANYGNLRSVAVSVYVTGAKRTPCGTGVEWGDVFEHEFGHALGLSHRQRYASSVMRDSNGHGPDATDRAELKILYGARRA